jgi:hypothetical protein
VFLGDAKRGRVRVCGHITVTHAHDDLDSGIQGALNHSLTIRIEFFPFNVSV